MRRKGRRERRGRGRGGGEEGGGGGRGQEERDILHLQLLSEKELQETNNTTFFPHLPSLSPSLCLTVAAEVV